MTTTLLKDALNLYDKGLAVVPIGGGKDHKAPLNSKWSTEKLTRTQVEYWFSNGHNPLGIGYIAGDMSGNRGNLDFDEGWEIGLENYLYHWPEHRNAPLYHTAHKRRQMILHIPDMPKDFGITIFKRDGVVIEFRGNGHNCVLPPTLHPGCDKCTPDTRNNRYTWLVESAEIPSVNFDALYDWLADWATEIESPYKDKKTPQDTPRIPQDSPNGQYKPLPRKTLEFLATPGLLPQGERNESLYAASQQLYAAGYSLDETISTLAPVARRVGLDEREIETTIKSGYTGANKAGFKPIAGKSKVYLDTLAKLGYSFKLNQCNDKLEVSGQPINDALRAKIRTELRDNGLQKHLAACEDAYLAHALENSYHPIKDKLDSLKWDGMPQIGTLASYFTDKDNVFYIWLKRWLVGAVAKVYEQGQNPMLVLDGAQNLGKSYFAAWLGSILPDHYIESPILPDDKDFLIRLASNFLWEVGELGSTFRRADRESLKFFITMKNVTVRPSYARSDITKPASCSLIGTINSEAGFLSDPTGNRRFLTCELTRIGWGYTELDAAQVWAEAVHLYRQGEPWRLSPDELTQQAAINARYRIESYAMGLLLKYFDVDPNEQDWTSSADILQHLESMGLRGNSKSHAMEISAGLKELGIRRAQKYQKGWGYFGVTRKVDI